MTREPAIPPSPSDDDHRRAEADLDTEAFTQDEPIALFADWFALAKANEPRDPHAMALATVDGDGMPDVRTVLLKDFGADGFVFYTNTQSAKGLQLAGSPKAALCFYWRSLVRQVRVRGEVTPVRAEEADAYFATRAKDSQIGAWASDQSRPLEGRFALEKKIAAYGAKYALGATPRPPHWSGYRLFPTSIEFWRERAFRLHDRVQFTRSVDRANWVSQRLYP